VIELRARDRAMAKQHLAEPQALSERIEDRIELALRQHLLTDENLAEGNAVLADSLPRERIAQLGFADKLLLNQQLPEAKFTGYHATAP
jgi:hypothetical protein